MAVSVADRRTCVAVAEPPYADCPAAAGSFECAADGRCIAAAFRCDGENDCADASDERNCSGLSIPITQSINQSIRNCLSSRATSRLIVKLNKFWFR